MAIHHRVYEYILKNGFKLLVKEDHRSPIAIFKIYYKVGSSHEHEGITGISHALEHMMFRGTTKYNANTFLQKLTESGGQHNAHTGRDYTAYYQLGGIEQLVNSFKFESDRMVHLRLREKDFLKEIQVIMEERRLVVEDDPLHRVHEHFSTLAYLTSPYRHPIIGWMHSLQQLSVYDLKNWYQRWYVPNNAVAVIVGDVHPREMYQLAKKYFGPLKPQPLPTIKQPYEIESFGIRKMVMKIPAKLPWLVMGYPTPMIATAKKPWEPFALLLLSYLLAGTGSSRLQKKMVRGKQIAVEVDTGYSPFTRLNGLFLITATPAPQHDLTELQKNITEEIRQLQQEPPARDELNRMKTQLIANRVYDRDSIVYQADEIGSLEAIGFSWKKMDEAYKQIGSITPKQITEVARRYLIEKNLVTTELEPLPLTKE